MSAMTVNPASPAFPWQPSPTALLGYFSDAGQVAGTGVGLADDLVSPDTYDSTASSKGVVQRRLLARIIQSHSGSNFFQPVA